MPAGAYQGEFAYTYDANGNVSEVVRADGQVAAHYEYDPFGVTVSATGAYAQANPYRFSTKFHDDITGMVDYGYRWYLPDLGRWPSRDPIGERGGVNLYGCVGNAGTIRPDFLGLKRLRLEYDMATDRRWGDSGTPVTGFSDVARRVALAINGMYSPEGKDPCNCIELLRIGGHGSSGTFTNGSTHFDPDAVFSGKWMRKLRENDAVGKRDRILEKVTVPVQLLRSIAGYMCKSSSIRWALIDNGNGPAETPYEDMPKFELAACSSGCGEEGAEFMRELESVFGGGRVSLYNYDIVWIFGLPPMWVP